MYEFGGQRYNRTLADKIEGVDIAMIMQTEEY